MACRYRWLALGTLLLLVLVFPVSAATRTVINPGATVFLGEQGLDISPAMGGYSQVAWWSFPLEPGIDSPSEIRDVSATMADFFVSPTLPEGEWYIWDGKNPPNPPLAFYVDDPTLNVRIWSWYGPSDVTGKAVVRGTPVGFQALTNLYQVGGVGLMGGYRGSAIHDMDETLIFRVRDSTGYLYTTLINETSSSIPLWAQFPTNMPFYWQGGGMTATWDTGAKVGGLNVYDPGTYTVYVESALNGMKDNYKDPSGADYVGKTVSPSYTFTLLQEPITISAAGSLRYYFGEDIRFSGTNTNLGTTYLFVTGPGLPANGAALNGDPKNSPVINGDPASFSMTPTEQDETWEFTWDTFEDINLDAGTYEVYAVQDPVDLNNLAGTNYAKIAIELREPFITATVSPSIGTWITTFTFSGVKEGGASPENYVYMLVTNSTFGGSLPARGVRPDDFSVEAVSGSTPTFLPVWVEADRSWSYAWNMMTNVSGGTLLPGSRYGLFLLRRPLDMIDAMGTPDSYTKVAIAIEGPVTADFTVDATNSPSVDFTDTSAGIPTTVTIDFGDGTNAVIQPESTTTHAYASGGTYAVTLTASNSLGSDSETRDVVVMATTRQEATDAVIASVLKNDLTGKTVYTSLNPVAAGFQVLGWSSSFTPQNTGWLVILDEKPKANWEHPVRWVQRADGGQEEITWHTSPPRNVAISRTAGDPLHTSGTNDPGSGYSGGYTGGGGGSGDCGDTDCGNCYALLISGGYNQDNNFDRYWNDLSSMYRTLRSTYCYPPDHIFVLMSDGTSGEIDQRTGDTAYADSPRDLDGDGIEDINGPATRQQVVDTLNMLNVGVNGNPPLLDSADDLFIFTSNHGGKDPDSDRVRLWLWNEEFLWDEEFADLLSLSPAKSVTVTMEQCYSGGFVDDLIDSYSGPQKRVLATAANALEPSIGNDFSFWWIDGVMGPANSEIYGGNGDEIVTLLEGFNYARDNDPSAAGNQEHPQFGSYDPPYGDTMGLSSCSHCRAPDPLPDCGTRICQPPLDPDLDGIYEDLDGQDGFTMDDVILFFANMKWITGHEPACALDPNGNGRIDFGDIVRLYQEVPP